MDPVPYPNQLSEVEMLQKLEDEHLRLQRQVKIIQADRLNRTMGVHPQFRRQDHLMRTLKWEYTDLVQNLKLAKSGAHKLNDKRMKTDLKKAILMRSKMQQEYKGGTDLMEELDGLIISNNKIVNHLRKLVNDNQGKIRERRCLSEKRLGSAEHQLEVAMLRFNSIQGENKRIREEIEHMLKDRAIFNQNWNKMLTALGKGKKFLQDLFESSTVAYDQRDEWVTKLRSVQEKARMNQMLQVQEMRDLQKSLVHETKLHEFLARKGVMRVNREQEYKELVEKQNQEEDLKKQVEEHHKVLDGIYDYTHERDLDRLIEDFKRREHENFSAYKLLTDYCAENQFLKRDLKNIRQELVDKRDWNEKVETERQIKLERMTSELESLKTKTNGLRMKNEEQKQRISDAMEKIVDMFNYLECSTEPFANLLGDKGPSVWNLHTSMALISEKIQGHVETVLFNERCCQKKMKAGSSLKSRLKQYTIQEEPPEIWTPLPLSCFVPTDPCSTCIEARWLSRVTDMPEVPFNKTMALEALEELCNDPAYVKTDRLHPLADCRLPRSRMILARRYM